MSLHAKKTGGFSLVLIGGGNIGSAVAHQVARMPSVGQLRIYDPDTYESDNVHRQGITLDDVGKPKAVALAEHCRKIRPDLDAQPIVARVEDSPMGMLGDADLILSATDSRHARQVTGTICHRLGRPMVDAGIHAADLIARVSVYLPGPDAPCVECGFSQRDYDIIHEGYFCDGRLKPTPPSNASHCLGALAASLQVIEAQKILEGDLGAAPASRQILLEARGHHLYVSPLKRNPRCRFDHESWTVHTLPAGSGRMGDLTDTGRRLLGGKPPAAVGLDGKLWVRRMVCACGAEAAVLGLQGRLEAMRCACGGQMQPQGFSMASSLSPTDLPDTPVGEIGLRNRDIVTIASSDGQHVHVELAGL